MMKFRYRALWSAVTLAALGMSVPAQASPLAPHFTTKEEVLSERPFEGGEDGEDAGSLIEDEDSQDPGAEDQSTSEDASASEDGSTSEGAAASENGNDTGSTAAEEGGSASEDASAAAEGSSTDESGENVTEGTGAETEGNTASAAPGDSSAVSKRTLHALPVYLNGARSLCPGYVFPSTVRLEMPQRSMTVLKAELQQVLAGYDGIWSVYMKDLTGGGSLVINDVMMPSASTLKLFILGTVYEEIANGTLERTSELVSTMTDMIRVSSNEAANRLMAILGDGDYAAGVKKINEYIMDHGYSEATRAYNPFQDSSLTIDPDHTNSACASDCGKLLEQIYRRTFGTRKVCNEVEEMMLAQETRYKIPKGVGENSLAANKTGETDEVEHDVAFVYTPAGDYILCVFSTGWADKKAAQSQITEISSRVWHFYTDSEEERKNKLFPELEELNRWLDENYPLAGEPYAVLYDAAAE